MYRPIALEQAERELDEARARLEELDQWLKGQGANGAAWDRYLRLTEVLREARRGLEGELEVLVDAQGEFYDTYAGLEMAPFVRAREALRRAARTRIAMRTPVEQAEEEWASRIEQLRASQARIDDPLARRELASAVAWLERHRQSSPLAEDAARRSSSPNLITHVRNELLARLLDQPEPEPTEVSDCILETAIRGHGVATTRVTPCAVTSEGGRATIDLLFDVEVDTRTIGYNGPVRIYSNGHTSLQARKRIVLTAERFWSEPTSAWGDTDSTTTGLATKFRSQGLLDRVVKKVARKRIARDGDKANAIAAEHAARDLEERLDEEIAAELAEARRDFESDVTTSLERVGQRMAIGFGSDGRGLRVELTRSEAGQVAAADQPQLLDAPVALAVHESFPANLLDTILAGRTFTDQELAAIVEGTIQDAGGAATAPSSPTTAASAATTATPATPEPARLRMQFSLVEPARVIFEGEVAEFRLSCERLWRPSDDRPGEFVALPRSAVDIVVRYTFVREPSGLVALRVGEAAIEPHRWRKPGTPRRLSVSELQWAGELQRDLNAEVDERIPIEPIQLPASGTLRELKVEQLRPHRGWLLVGASAI